ncbi:lamin tail domain-containing protein [Olleya sp. YS]|uniref:lamin tail domain-containing protein n=1 Tax=Olleya sp. YS TaxID=3028318 RepID=UPI00243432B6|nr:lamin tail domain-containing protein [Olleya sp. YS]WGD35980.1 lamin tail domain-containing protein [Olleya sp. YS]
MKKNIPFVFFLFSLFSFSQTSDLIISEYGEGSGNNKFIEIYNGTGSSVNLADYQIWGIANGGSWPETTINLSGTLTDGSTYVLSNNLAIPTILLLADSTSGSASWNGDDAVGLAKDNGSGTFFLIDAVGTDGADPGSGWNVAGTTNATANHTLVRKSSVCDPNTNWTVSAGTNTTNSEWIVLPQDDISDLGSHTATCSACTPTHTITSFTPTTGPIGSNVTITGTGFTAGSTVDFNGTAAVVTFINSTTLSAVVQAGTTTGLVTVTEAGCPVDSTTNFTVGACTPVQSITSFAPNSGPELSHITITGTGFTAGSTVDFNGTSATIISQTVTQIVAEVPLGATTGVITVTELGCPVDSSTDFTVLSGSCSGGGGGIPAGFTDLMFSGIYDETSGSCHYIQLLNPTSSDIDLSNYSIGSSNNQTDPNSLPGTYNGGTYPLSGTILAGDTFLILATSDTSNCASCTNVTLDLQFLSSALGYNGFTSANYDKLVLINSGTAIDLWSNGDGHDNGYIYTRANTATAPALTFTSSEWVSDTTPDCFGFEIEITPSPTIDVQPADIDNCDAANVNISVTAGGGGTLSYQWKYNNGTAGWLDVTGAAFNPGIVTGETTTDLSITGFNLDGYQFYCEVTESGVCSIATDAIQINMSSTTWNGLAWTNGLPDLTKMVVLDGSYDTSINGSFQACSLIINTSGTSPEFRLTITDNTFVEVENTVTVDGELYVETQGAFVQNNNASLFNLTSNGVSLVNKETTPLNSIYEYTYWSSPVENTTINQGLAFSNPNRRYWFNAANYLDVQTEINNTNTFTPGSDGIDDDGNDWTYISDGNTVMTPGVGYISMHNPVGFTTGLQYTYTFNGVFNTGIITSPIIYNGANGDEDWNLIGNPYPSAIDANAFLTANSSTIQGVVYLWSHNTPADANASGNEGQNFSNSDYAIITQGSGNTAGGDMIIPNDYIPSGQSFFVQGITNGNVTFDNSFRMADASSNTQFFRANDTTISNKIWVNLTSDTGVFHQILVAYVNGATNGKDSMAYDANRTLYDENKAEIYTMIPNETDKFAIQGKAPESLTIDEVIPLGFDAKTTAPTIYTLSIAQVQGDFFDNNTVYLIDYLNNTIHDLSASDYSFTSSVGTFNNRFEIVFNPSVLSTIDYTNNTTNLSIVELSDDLVKFSVSNNLTIKSIKILDVLGKEIYTFKCNDNSEIINLEKLQQSLYFAQIKLSNGLEITKKAVKK